jgi:hypothetical protein
LAMAYAAVGSCRGGFPSPVIPAQAGIQSTDACNPEQGDFYETVNGRARGGGLVWIPACAGMTEDWRA